MKVEFYVKENGDCPFEDFLDSLSSKIKNKTLRTIMLLRLNGTELREPHSKNLGNGIFELRTKFSSDISRAIYFFVKNDKAIITNGFIKKSDKTPDGEIRKAEKYRKDYLRRNKNEKH